MSVVITEDDFDIAAEHNKLKSASVGALVTFTGTVRDLGGGEAIASMTLEHYPGMTESEINKIINTCLLYTSPSPRDRTRSRMPSSA